MVKLRLAPAARDDLREIRTYSKAIFGPGVARIYLDGMRDTFSLLQDRPSVGAIESDLGEGMRGIAYRSHRIYYHVAEHDVLIVRILHHSRNALRTLKREQ